MTIDLKTLDREEFFSRWATMTKAEREFAMLALDKKLYPSPIELAVALDPKFVVTPALRLIDQKLRQVAKAVECMYERRALLVELLRDGMDEATAIERVVEMIPQRGITRLILSMPPQEGKSTLVSRHGVEWLLRLFPMLRVTLTSYDGVNAGRISYQVRNDIELFNGQDGNLDLGLRLMPDQKAMGRWMLTTGGGIYAIGVGGGLTGHPSDLALIDDPLKDLRAADSILQARQQMDWWQTVMRPRLAPWAVVVLVSTRWGDNDLPGQLITQRDEAKKLGLKDYDDWEVLNIPAQAKHDPSKGETDPLGREPGEFMVSARGRTQADWEATKAVTPERFWQSLYQGDPTPGTGTIFLREWWPEYDRILWTQQPDGTFRVPGYDLTQSWDFAFKDTAASDYVVGELWAKRGADSFLVYLVRARLSFPATIDAVRMMTRLFPTARRKLVEDKANGPAVIASLKKEIPGIIAVNPTTSKTARAEAVSPFVRAGNLHVPSRRVAMVHPALAFDVEAFLNEHTSFPNGANDDQVDATTQYLSQTYLDGGTAAIISPVGRTRAANVTPQERELSPMQRRLLAKAANDDQR